MNKQLPPQNRIGIPRLNSAADADLPGPLMLCFKDDFVASFPEDPRRAHWFRSKAFNCWDGFPVTTAVDTVLYTGPGKVPWVCEEPLPCCHDAPVPCVENRVRFICDESEMIPFRMNDSALSDHRDAVIMAINALCRIGERPSFPDSCGRLVDKPNE